MAEYTLKHFDASATRAHMEGVVETFNRNSAGQIKVLDYKIATLVVEAEDSVAEAFGKAHPYWGVKKVVYADASPPQLNLDRVRRNLDI